MEAATVASSPTGARRFRLPSSFPIVGESLVPEVAKVAFPSSTLRNATPGCGVLLRPAGLLRAPCCLPDPVRDARTSQHLGILIEVEGSRNHPSGTKLSAVLLDLNPQLGSADTNPSYSNLLRVFLYFYARFDASGNRGESGFAVVQYRGSQQQPHRVRVKVFLIFSGDLRRGAAAHPWGVQAQKHPRGGCLAPEHPRRGCLRTGHPRGGVLRGVLRQNTPTGPFPTVRAGGVSGAGTLPLGVPAQHAPPQGVLCAPEQPRRGCPAQNHPAGGGVCAQIPPRGVSRPYQAISVGPRGLLLPI
ncbi:hypothetical protein Taro_006103 [Colocasia esculenta]|uniref:Uncharacterized protein n=1 Tax=Colocasia esculenta TaxID=4460 RepID=A0A843TRQ9_COLES|nr:hypothetical protein [Colocasia esculenta]